MCNNNNKSQIKGGRREPYPRYKVDSSSRMAKDEDGGGEENVIEIKSGLIKVVG